MSAIAERVTVEGRIATVTVDVAVAPSRSVTTAVRVCVPSERLGTSSSWPVPSAPSRLDVHRMVALRSPSSASEASPLRSTALPASSAPPSSGLMMLTTGGTFGPRMTSVTCV